MSVVTYRRWNQSSILSSWWYALLTNSITQIHLSCYCAIMLHLLNPIFIILDKKCYICWIHIALYTNGPPSLREKKSIFLFYESCCFGGENIILEKIKHICWIHVALYTNGPPSLREKFFERCFGEKKITIFNLIISPLPEREVLKRAGH